MFSFFFPYIVSLPPNECETYHKNIPCLICLSGALRCRPKEVSMPRFYLRKDYVKGNGKEMGKEPGKAERTSQTGMQFDP